MVPALPQRRPEQRRLRPRDDLVRLGRQEMAPRGQVKTQPRESGRKKKSSWVVTNRELKQKVPIERNPAKVQQQVQEPFLKNKHNSIITKFC